MAIRVKVGDRTEGRVNVRKLVFTPGNWRRNQTVVLTGKDDRGRDGNQFFQVELKSARSRDAAYRGADADDVWARNKDDDRRRGRRRGRRTPPPARFAAPIAVAAPAFAPNPVAAAPAGRPGTPAARPAAPAADAGDAPAGTPEKAGAGAFDGAGPGKPARAAFDAAFLTDLTGRDSWFGLPA